MRIILRWVVLAAALVVGLLAARASALVEPAHGGTAATMLVSDTLPLSIGLTAAYLALAAVIGVGAGRIFGLRTGLFAAGVALIGPTWAGGTVASLIRFAQSGAPLRMLAVEGAIVGAAGVGMTWLIARTARKRAVDETDPPLSAQSALGFAVAAGVGGVVAWVVAREGLKGQTFAAAAIAGLLGATLARWAAHRASAVAVVAGIAALAIAGPAVGAAMAGGEAVAKSYSNALFPLAWLTPLDWVAGALFGVPLGLAWGASMVERKA